MSETKINVIDARTGRPFPAAPNEAVLLSSADRGWRGIAVERQRLGPTEMPTHYVDGHRLLIHAGAPTRFEWRVERAMSLVRRPAGQTLTTIAQNLGFFDQAHFTHAFKRMTGVTPKVFAAG